MRTPTILPALALLFAALLPAQVTAPLQSLQLSNVTTPIDNRSNQRHFDLHTAYCVGFGTWSCQIQYSDVSANGPWANFAGVQSLADQTTIDGIARGTGYHSWISLTVVGTVIVNYTGVKGLYIGTMRGLPVLAAPLTTAAAASDAVAIPGVTAASLCWVGAANASAAANLATTYISSVSTGSVAVAHAVTAAMAYNVFCAIQ